VWVKRRCAKSENLPTQKSYSMYSLTMGTEFLQNLKKNILKFANFSEFSTSHVLNSQSMAATVRCKHKTVPKDFENVGFREFSSSFFVFCHLM